MAWRRLVASGEEMEGVVQPGGDLLHGQVLRSRRRQLQRQRQARQAATDLHDGRDILRRQGEAGPAPGCTLHEESDRVVHEQLREAGQWLELGSR